MKTAPFCANIFVLVRLLLYSACVSLLFGATCLADSRKITIIFGAEYAPFYMQGPTDGMTPVRDGMFVEFLEAFEEEYNYAIRKLRFPRKRLDHLMDHSAVEAFSLNNPLFVKNPGNFLFTQPIWRTKDVVVSRKSSPLSYRSPEDLFGRRVGVISGNGYGLLDQYFAEGMITAVDVVTQHQLIHLLSSERVDCFIGNIHATPYAMKTLGMHHTDFFFSEEAVLEFDLMTQVNPQHRQLYDDLNAFILQSHTNGFIESLEMKYR